MVLIAVVVISTEPLALDLDKHLIDIAKFDANAHRDALSYLTFSKALSSEELNIADDVM